MNVHQIAELTEQLAALICKEDVDVKAEHPGILKLKGKDFLKTGAEHFIKVAKDTVTKDGRTGRQQVTNALLNLERWNKNRDPKTSAHAKKMVAALEKGFDDGGKTEGY